MRIEEFLTHFENVKQTGGGGYMALCPAHADKNGSLSISTGTDGKILLKCFAGCNTRDVLAARGLEMKDLFPEPVHRPQAAAKAARRVVAEYEYYKKDGTPIIKVVRFDPKGFGRMSPDGRGGWKWGGSCNTGALYKWQELAQACKRGERVYLVEGEKDVENLLHLSPAANVTTVLGGASKWRPEYAAEFSGAGEVVIIADNDAAPKYTGQRFAIKERSDIASVGGSVIAATLPGEINGKRIKDASDAIAAGWTFDDFEQWANTAQDLNEQDFKPPQNISDDETGGTLKEVIDRARRDVFYLSEKGNPSKEEIADAISKAGIEWLTKAGGWYLNAENVNGCGSYYFYRAERRLMPIEDLNGNKGHLYFYAWLSTQSGIPVVKPAFKQLLAECQRTAKAGETTLFKPALFWDRRKDDSGETVVYLSSGDGEFCRINAESVQMVDNGTDGVLFLSGRTLKKWYLLPENEAKNPVESCRVFRDMAVLAPHLIDLLLLWVLAIPLNHEWKPPLALIGCSGSGKSKTAQGILELYGFLEPIIFQPTEKNEDDFFAIANYGGAFCVDNIDKKRIPWLADAISAAATGGGTAKRQLYTDSELSIQKARAWTILTSSSPYFAADEGAADRLCIIRLGRNNRPTADAVLIEEIRNNRNACLSFIAYTIQKALKMREPVPAEIATQLNRRFPDWGEFCWKCGVVLGMKDRAQNALMAAEFDKSILNVQVDAFGDKLLKFMQFRVCKWTGTPKQLQEALKTVEGDSKRGEDMLNEKQIGQRLKSGWHYFRSVFGAEKRKTAAGVVYTFNPPSSEVLQCLNNDEGAEVTEPGGTSTGEHVQAAPLATARPFIDVNEFPIVPYNENDPL